MYFEYLKERYPRYHVIEFDHGFCTFYESTFKNEKATYIENIYVRPQYRQTQYATKLSEEVQRRAIAVGSKYLLGTVDPDAQGATISLKTLLGHGMTVDSIDNDLIWFYKEL